MKDEQSRGAGISLPPSLVQKARAIAKAQGYATLSALVRKLLTDYIHTKKRRSKG